MGGLTALHTKTSSVAIDINEKGMTAEKYPLNLTSRAGNRKNAESIASEPIEFTYQKTDGSSGWAADVGLGFDVNGWQAANDAKGRLAA